MQRSECPLAEDNDNCLNELLSTVNNVGEEPNKDTIAKTDAECAMTSAT